MKDSAPIPDQPKNEVYENGKLVGTDAGQGEQPELQPDFKKWACELRDQVTSKTHIDIFDLAKILEIVFKHDIVPIGKLRDYYREKSQPSTVAPETIDFAVWYSGMARKKVLSAYARWKNESEPVSPSEEEQTKFCEHEFEDYGGLAGGSFCIKCGRDQDELLNEEPLLWFRQSQKELWIDALHISDLPKGYTREQRAEQVMIHYKITPQD